MTRFLLAAGVAALAITAPAISKPDNKGGGNDRAQAQKAERGGGKARAQRSERRAQSTQRANRVERRAQRSERVERRAQRSERAERRAQRPERAQRVERRAQRNDNRAQRVERRADRVDNRGQRLERRAQRVDDRGNRMARQQARALERQQNRVERRANVENRLVRQQDRQLARIAERRGFQLDRRDERRELQLARLANRNVLRADDWGDLARGGIWLDGCPPGLAKKPVACVPPGQVNRFVGQPLNALSDQITFRELPDRLRYVYRDTDDYYYRYGNGYVYQVNRQNDLISSLLPLFGLGLTVGQQFPSAYSNYYMPTGLQSFYPDTPYTSYRYANGYVYEVDPYTGLIEDVDPLLGYGYGYGQMMPVTYSAYNVPYQYRSMYYDTPDHYYRYAPGAIYQVDPTTSLITAVAALLTGGLNVGQPLPTGYGVYNVPYDYRTTYYDTPDAWYRYSNGHIYRVDPRTQLVTALVASVLT